MAGSIHVYDPENNGLNGQRVYSNKKQLPPRDRSGELTVHTAPNVTPQVVPGTSKEGRRSRHAELKLQAMLREQGEVGVTKPPFVFLINIELADHARRADVMTRLGMLIMQWEYQAIVSGAKTLTAPTLYDMRKEHGDPFDGISVSGVSPVSFEESRLLIRDLYKLIDSLIGPVSLTLRLGGFRGLLTYDHNEAAKAAEQGAQLIAG